MTTKEKAKDLFDMFNSKNDILFHQLDKEGAKQCALIAVDEILDFMDIFDLDLGMKNQHKWWKEVKQEIENL